MIEYNRSELAKAAKKYGFVRDTYEKVLRLKEVLKYINEEEYLGKHLILKGGTAINMTIFNLPRLSVDIDLDFIPNYSREETQISRKKIAHSIKEYMEEEGYQLSSSSRFSHSLDSFLFQYQNAGGNRDNIKIELNYSLRAHIFSPVNRKIVTGFFDDQPEIKTLTPVEIFAAKANALMSRAAARDLYDFSNMIYYGLFEESEYEILKKCIIFYASISSEVINKEFDTSAIDNINFTKIRRDLFPVLRNKEKFDLEARKSTVKSFIKELMTLTEQEQDYLKAFEQKEYKPELLFSDEKILENIRNHPMARWKTRGSSNV